MKIVRTLCALVGISTLAAASRTMMSADRRTLSGFLRNLVLGTFVAVIVGLLIQDLDYSPSTQYGIVGVAAIVADDVLLFVINGAAKLREDPMIIINWFLRRGGGGQ